MRYIIGLLVTLGLLVLLIVLIVHGGSGGSKTKVPNTPTSLISYATTDATARLSIDGPITASEKHNTAQIIVGQDSATFQLVQGYDGNVVSSKSYPSSANSFNAFLHALDRVGFTDGDSSSALKDEGGYCAEGDRYVLELQQDGKDLERYWATSCGKPKTYEGNIDVTLDLFKAQIPDYDSLVQNANL